MHVPESLWIALSRIAGTDWPPSTAQDADVLVQRSIGEGLLMLLAEREDVPHIGDALRRVGAMRHASLRRTEVISGVLARLHALLEGEPYVLLKGCDYAYRLYAHPSLRQAADIDFLVPRERMHAVAERLIAAGAQQKWAASVSSRVEPHHETVFDLGGVTLEPHHSFIQRARHRIDYDAVWARRVPLDTPAGRTFRLADEDAILYHALSLCLKYLAVPLVRYLDLYLLLECFDRDPAILVRLARESRMQRAFFAALTQTLSVFPELDVRWSPVARELVSRRVGAMLRRSVLPELLQGRVPTTRREQLWRKFHLMDGYRERLGFALYHAYALVAGSLQARTRRA